jgi:hypothetical protein
MKTTRDVAGYMRDVGLFDECGDDRALSYSFCGLDSEFFTVK